MKGAKYRIIHINEVGGKKETYYLAQKRVLLFFWRSIEHEVYSYGNELRSDPKIYRNYTEAEAVVKKKCQNAKGIIETYVYFSAKGEEIGTSTETSTEES